MLSLLFYAAAVMAGLYLAAAILLFIFQRNLLYRPDKARIPPAAVGLTGVEETELKTPDGERLIVWRATPEPGKPVILYFQGNGGGLALRRERAQRFMSAGYGLFMLGYRGYSGSTGSPTEPRLIEDGLLAFDTLVKEGIERGRIVLYGESLGTGIAVRVAAARRPGAVILDAPYTSIAAVAKRAYGLFPVDLFLHDRFDSAKFVGVIKAPLLVLHGSLDAVIPLSLGQALFDLAPEPKKMAVFERGGHSDLYAHGAMQPVRAFLDEHLAKSHEKAGAGQVQPASSGAR